MYLVNTYPATFCRIVFELYDDDCLTFGGLYNNKLINYIYLLLKLSNFYFGLVLELVEVDELLKRQEKYK